MKTYLKFRMFLQAQISPFKNLTRCSEESKWHLIMKKLIFPSFDDSKSLVRSWDGRGAFLFVIYESNCIVILKAHDYFIISPLSCCLIKAFNVCVWAKRPWNLLNVLWAAVNGNLFSVLNYWAKSKASVSKNVRLLYVSPFQHSWPSAICRGWNSSPISDTHTQWRKYLLT